MSPFNPIGERARWRTLYEIVRQTPTDSEVTYEALAAALALDPEADRHTIQLAMRRASKESEVKDARALEAVPNVGYRVVKSAEHLRLAKNQQKKSHNALVRGQSKVEHVDLAGMEPEIRRAFEVVAQAFAMQAEFMRRTDIRQRKVEAAIAEVQGQSSRSEAEISALKERLARLEGLLPDANS